MITPSYSLTATERVLPKLSLDWTTGLPQTGVDVVRAGVATFVGSNGLIQSALADTQRIDYLTGTAGLLVEESRINNAAYSEAFGNAAWAKANASISSDVETAPDGAFTADKLIEDTATAAHYIISSAMSMTSGVFYTGSVFAKAAERSVIQLTFQGATHGSTYFANFNLANGTLGNSGGSGLVRNITSFGNGWYRCSISAPATTTASGGFTMLPLLSAASGRLGTYLGDGTSGLLVWGAQLETGAFSTSYIPNLATGTTTRNADVATMTGTNFSDWFNASEGAFVFQGSLYAFEAGKGHLAIRSSSTDYMRIRTAPSGSTEVRFESVVANVSQVALTPSTINVSSFAEAFAYKQDNYAVSVGRGTVLTDTSGTVPTANAMYIGATPAGVTQYNGYIQKILYYPQRLTNAEIQALSR